MADEIPIWVEGTVQWLSGVDRRTTVKDVIELFIEGGAGGDVNSYEIVERWKQVERPLDMDSRLLKIWSHWGSEQKEVKLCLRRVENDSGRGSPITPSMKRRRNRRTKSTHPEGYHPKRLAELGGFNPDEYDEYQLQRLQDEKRRKPHRCPATGVLHSTAIEGKSKKCCSKRPKNSENIEKLMKLILAQGATIQTQLSKLKEREQQIENIEVERHKERVEQNGRNYLLETYLKGLKEAEVPEDEEKGEDSGVHTEAGSEQNKELRKEDEERGRSRERTNGPRSRSENRTSSRTLMRTLSDGTVGEETKEDDIVELRRVQSQVEMWEKVLKINKKLEKEEENLVKLHIQIRRIQSENIKFARNDDPIAQSIQNQLETLRTDLDQNSKEIYQNFTKLIEDDEQVVKKQNYLSELLTDLERTDQEHNILVTQVQDLKPSLPETQRPKISFKDHEETKTTPSPVRNLKGILKRSSDFRIDLAKAPAAYGANISTDDTERKISMTSLREDPEKKRETIYQPESPGGHLYQTILTLAPRPSLGTSTEQLPPGGRSLNPCSIGRPHLDAPLQTPPAGRTPSDPTYSFPTTYQTSSAGRPVVRPSDPTREEPVLDNSYVLTPGGRPPDVNAQTSPAGPKVLDPSYVPPYQTPSGGRPSETAHKTPPYPTAIITRAIVHDNDSSGSSDTSGLSSMYSASPTVDEPNYVFNTLV